MAFLQRFVLLLLFARPGFAAETLLSPMYSPIRLIAGNGERGFSDGNFIRASFDTPRGLVLSPDGKILYVADAGNHAVRAIALEKGNEVSTLVGVSAQAGSLRNPTDLAVSLDGKTLYIFDRGAKKILNVDLDSKALGVLADLGGNPDGSDVSGGMVLDAKNQRLYVVDASAHSLKAVQIATKSVVTVADDPLFGEAGTQLALSPVGLRCFNSARAKIYSLIVGGKELGLAKMEASSPTAQGQLALKFDTDPALQGFTPAGLPGQAGLLLWDGQNAQFRSYEGKAPAFQLKDYEDVVRSASQPATVPPKHLRPVFEKRVALAYDAERSIIYVAEPDHHRISAVRDDTQATNNRYFRDHDYPLKKAPGVTRILMFGGSYIFYSADEPEEAHKVLPAQFQFYLNMLSALQGTGKQYEVLYCAGPGRSIGSGEIYVRGKADLLKQYEIDQVALTTEVSSLYWQVTAWKITQTKDDVAVTTEDPEWATMSAKEKLAKIGPVGAQMLALCKEHPEQCGGSIEASPDGDVDYKFNCNTSASFFEPTAIKDLSLQILKKVATKTREFCKSVGVKPVYFVLPTKEIMGGVENDVTCKTFSTDVVKGMADTYRGLGMTTVEVTEPMRMADGQMYPLWSFNDGHMNHRGMEWSAYMMAHYYLKELENEAKSAPGR